VMEIGPHYPEHFAWVQRAELLLSLHRNSLG